MKKLLYILIFFLFSLTSSYASKTDEIKKINEMFINGYITENECADLKYDVWKEFFPDTTYSCKNLKQKKITKKEIKGLDEVLTFGKSYKEIISIYEEFGWENQQVFDVFIEKQLGYLVISDEGVLITAAHSFKRLRK